MSKRTPSIPNPHARKYQLPCRVSAAEMILIKNLAKKFAGENISLWVRSAALNYIGKLK